VTNIGYGTASGGNADLKPIESQNYDVSLEVYFSPGSILYGTWFKRDITTTSSITAMSSSTTIPTTPGPRAL